MKILFHVDSMEYGGIGTYVYNVAVALRDMGTDVTVCATADGPMLSQFEREHFRSFVTPHLIDLRGKISILKPQVLHGQVLNGNSCLVALGSDLAIPVIVTQHEAVPYSFECPQNRYEIALGAFVKSRRPFVHVISPSWNLLDPVGLEEIRNTRRTFGIPQEAFVIGRVSRLVPHKAMDVFLEAVAASPQVWGLICGDGPERNNILSRSTVMGCRDRIVVTGAFPDDVLAKLYGAMDVIVHPSEREGLCFGVVEPLLFAKAVISVPHPGICENILHGITGLLAASLDEIVSAIELLRTNDSLMRSLGEAGRRHLISKGYCDPSRLSTAYLQVYKRAIEESTVADSVNQMH